MRVFPYVRTGDDFSWGFAHMARSLAAIMQKQITVSIIAGLATLAIWHLFVSPAIATLRS